VVAASGIEQVLVPDLNEIETAAMIRSASTIQAAIAGLATR
jgi:hypothetical protein